MIEDAISVLENWNQRHGSLWQIRESDLNWNFREQDWVSYQVALIDGVKTIVAVATAVGIQNGLSEKSLWLSLWSEIPEGREKKFLFELTEFTKKKNKSRLAIGGDEFHFLPGIPIGNPSGDKFMAATQEKDFQGARVVDFVGPLEQKAVNEYVAEGLQLSKEKNWQFTEVDSSHRSLVGNFMNREFPGRWSREFEFWQSRKDTKRGQWFVLTAERLTATSEILGFARLAVRGNQKPLDEGWTPGALRLSWESGFSATDGCLGPIGVAKSLRGQGAGKVLLAHVLGTLKSSFAQEICIDWTDAIRYYSALNFREVRNYWTTWKSGSL